MKVNMDYFLGQTNVVTPVYDIITEEIMDTQEKFQKIASSVAKEEGKKSQTPVGNIREILRILVKQEKETPIEKEGPLSALLKMAQK